MNKKELKARMKELSLEMDMVRGELERLKEDRFSVEPRVGTVLKWRRVSGDLFCAVRTDQGWSYGSGIYPWEMIIQKIGSSQCWRMEPRSEIPGSIGHGDH